MKPFTVMIFSCFSCIKKITFWQIWQISQFQYSFWLILGLLESFNLCGTVNCAYVKICNCDFEM